MSITTYILAAPYGMARQDFARLLQHIDTLVISRPGPQRRVQVSVDEHRIAEVRRALPPEVHIEIATGYDLSGASETG